MKRIDIKKEFPDDRMSREAGERLRNMILDAVNEGGRVEVDFGGLIIASTSFLDEGLAKLASHGWTPEKLKSAISFKNLHPRDRKVMEDLFDTQALKSRKAEPVRPFEEFVKERKRVQR
ncbi:MAG: STAS-like domain-containing protein [bacterium]